MKKKGTLLFGIILILCCILSACSSGYSRVGSRFVCDETTYYHQNYTVNGWVVFCGDEILSYSEQVSTPENKSGINVCATADNTVVGALSWESPEQIWGKAPSEGYWVSERISPAMEQFLQESYFSYRLLTAEADGYYDLGQQFPENDAYLMQDKAAVPFTAGIFDGVYQIYGKTWYPILGCDASGDLGWIIGAVIVDGKNCYYARVWPGQYTNEVTATRLTKEGQAAFFAYLENSEAVKPTVTPATSLEGTLRQERLNRAYVVWAMILIFAVLPILVLLLVFHREIWAAMQVIGVFFLHLFKVLWEKITHREPKEELPPVYEEDLKPLNIYLSKEDLARGPVEDPEDEVVPDGGHRFCPHCGHPCDWTSFRCASCGAELRIGGHRVIKVEPKGQAPVPGKGGPGGYIMDLDAVSYGQYIRDYAPESLRKSAKRFSFWYFLITGMEFFVAALLYGVMLSLTQSASMSLISFTFAAILLVFALFYRTRAGIVSASVFAVYGIVSMISDFASLGDMVGVYPLPYMISYVAISVFCGLLPLLGLYRTIQMYNAYRDFKNGRIYQ